MVLIDILNMMNVVNVVDIGCLAVKKEYGKHVTIVGNVQLREHSTSVVCTAVETCQGHLASNHREEVENSCSQK